MEVNNSNKLIRNNIKKENSVYMYIENMYNCVLTIK